MEEFLAIGSEGEKVRQLQEQLKAREYDIKADGIYGEETRAAVIRFQESKGLKPDGIVSPETASHLGMEEVLQMGSTGDKVRKLQTKLNARGYEIKVDGIFGEETRAAVTRFQESNSLVPDGIVCFKTRLGVEAVGLLTGLEAMGDAVTPKPKPKPKPR
ncbi:MAG: peptidoglycan-binding protein [Planktothrix rubescens PR222]